MTNENYSQAVSITKQEDAMNVIIKHLAEVWLIHVDIND